MLTTINNSKDISAEGPWLKYSFWVAIISCFNYPVFSAENPLPLTIQNSSVSAQIESISVDEVQQSQLQQLVKDQAPAYQDKVMSVPKLLELTSSEAEQVLEGFQSFAFETRADYADSKSNKVSSRKTGDVGLRGEYLYETQNYGDLKVQVQTSQQADNRKDASLQFEDDSADTSVTLFNNNLSLTPTITADSALGDMSSDVTDALRRGARFSLGIDSVRGARTRIYNKNFDLRLGSGELGDLKGSPYTGYQKTDGRLSWFGASHTVGEHIVVGVQANRVDGFTEPAEQQAEINSLALAVNYKDDSNYNKHLRTSFIKSQHDLPNQKTEAQGIQIEAGFQLGRYAHEFGIYQSDPELYFGNNLLPSNQQGAYWRVQRQSARLNWGLGLEFERDKGEQTQQVSDLTNFDGNFQYRVDRDHSYGGNVRIEQTRYARAEQNDRRSIYSYFYYQLLNADWGRSRLSTTLHRNEKVVSNDVAATGDEFQWEQDWLGTADKVLNAQPELITTLGIAHDRSNGEKQTYPTAGINGRYWLNPDWSLTSSLRYSSRSGRLSTSQGISGSMASEYKLSQGLRVGASLNLNQAKVEVDSNGLNAAQTLRSNDKSAQIYLSWEGSRGQGQQFIGRRTEGLAGTGSTIGYVFSDTNQDGQRQADEIGVPDVEVYLDGGFSARTNKYGYFEFTRVATGKHQLTLNLDTVPLPWSVKEDSVSVDVSLRGQVTANLALIKGTD